MDNLGGVQMSFGNNVVAVRSSHRVSAVTSVQKVNAANLPFDSLCGLSYAILSISRQIWPPRGIMVTPD